MAHTLTAHAPQEVPVTVAGELLDSALHASIDVPVAPPGAPPGPGPAVPDAVYVGPALVLIAVAVALLLVRGWRSSTATVAAPAIVEPAPVAEPPLRGVRERRARPVPKTVALPPHVVATLERLARERAGEQVPASPEPSAPPEDEGAPEAPVRGGIEYWVGR